MFTTNTYIFESDLNNIDRKARGFGRIRGLNIICSDYDETVTVSGGVAIIGRDNDRNYAFYTSATVFSFSSGLKPRKALIYIDEDGIITYSLGQSQDAQPANKVGKDTYIPAPPDIPKETVLLAEIWLTPLAGKASKYIVYPEKAISAPIPWEVIPPKKPSSITYSQGKAEFSYSVPEGYVAKINALHFWYELSTKSVLTSRSWAVYAYSADGQLMRKWPESLSSFGTRTVNWHGSGELLYWTVSQIKGNYTDQTYPLPEPIILDERESIMLVSTISSGDWWNFDFLIRERKKEWF